MTSTLHRILSNVSHDELEIVFRDFFSKSSKGKNIAIDGKWLNGSDVNGQYLESKHKSVLRDHCTVKIIIYFFLSHLEPIFSYNYTE